MSIPLESIPHPKRLPVLQNLLSINIKKPIYSVSQLALDYYPIMELKYPNGETLVFVTSQELCKEICDESRFTKNINYVVERLKPVIGAGLFTQTTDSQEWEVSHRILLKGFSQKGMKAFHPYMVETSRMLLDRWSKIPSATHINLTTDMTNVTLETIGLCGFNYRFHSLESDTVHPFIEALLSSLQFVMESIAIPEFVNKLRRKRVKKFEQDTDHMYRMVDTIIEERKRSPEKYQGVHDLLNIMLHTEDTVTGTYLKDHEIRDQIITLLIAGHETTSGMLSYAFYSIIKHPEVAKRAYEEVDAILGKDLTINPEYSDVNKLKYIKQILYESLRLCPTGVSFAVEPKEDTVIGGKYFVRKGQSIQVLLTSLHVQEEAWGKDALVFNPDNFSSENVKQRPSHVYKPFGNGQRSCLGKHFALHEATLIIGMILQRYKLFLQEGYELRIQETLTIKPKDLMIRMEKRKDLQTPPAHSNLSNTVHGNREDGSECPFRTNDDENHTS